MAISFLLVFALLLLPQMAYGQQPGACSAPYTQRGFQLQNNIIKTTSAITTASRCMQECRLHNQCYSINYRNEKRICELNDANHLTNPEDLTFSPGHDYKNSPARSPSNCSIKYCSRKTDKCLIDRNGRDYKCVACKDDGGQEIMNFHQANLQNKVVLENWFESLKAFSVCSWNQPTSKPEQTLFSYATSSHSNEILLELKQQDPSTTFFQIFLLDAEYGKIVSYPANGGWHHLCLTWENTYGKWKIYIDSSMKEEGTMDAGMVIGKGAVVLGQDQDSYKGGFDLKESYQGNLTNVNLWDRVLTSQEVADLSRSCAVGEGNVIMWSDFTARVEGDIQLLCSHDCGI